jgi:hypothetical protein
MMDEDDEAVILYLIGFGLVISLISRHQNLFRLGLEDERSLNGYLVLLLLLIGFIS